MMLALLRGTETDSRARSGVDHLAIEVPGCVAEHRHHDREPHEGRQRAEQQLEQALDSFDGTLLLVTHDRRMLDTVRLTRRWEVRAGQLSEIEADPMPAAEDS